MTPTVQRRDTKQRAAVSAALEQVEVFVSAQQLHAQLREAGDRVGLATVYRTLQHLAEDGVVDVLRTDEGEAVYRRCGRSGHHHHLICRNCRKAVEVDSAAVEAWAAAVGAEHGFSQVDHVVEVYGTCADCSPKGASTPV